MQGENKDIKLMDLITELAHDFQLDDDKLKSYIDRFNNIYSGNYRHGYSTITRVLFLIENDEQRDYLPEKIKNINEKMKTGDPKKSVAKLWDHINLENIRLAELKKIAIDAENAVNDVERKVNSINNGTTKAQKKLTKIENNIKNNTAQSITILGIFGAIIVAFFGGISFLGGILNNMHSVSIYRLVFISVLILMGLFNIIFSLLYCISKLIEGKLTSSECRDCMNCNEASNNKCKGKIKRIYKRYPLVFIFNLVGIVLISLTFTMYIMDKYSCLTRVIELMGLNASNGLYIIIISILIIICLGILVLFILTVIYWAALLINKIRTVLKNNEEDENQNEIDQ